MKANLKEKKKGAIIEKFKNKCVIRKIIPMTNKNYIFKIKIKRVFQRVKS